MSNRRTNEPQSGDLLESPASRGTPPPSPLPPPDFGLTQADLDELANALPHNMLHALTPRQRITFLATLAGANPTQALTLAGYRDTSKSTQNRHFRALVLRLEQTSQLHINQWLAMGGASDYEISAKIGEMMHGEDKRVAFWATKLAAQLKGHLENGRDTRQAATTIHLHVMPAPGSGTVDNGQGLPSNAKPIIDLNSLISEPIEGDSVP